MPILPFLPARKTLRLLAPLCALAVLMAGFGGPAQADAQATEPQTVGPATNLAASVDWQDPGYIHLTWTPAENAQVHYILYLTSADNAAGSFDNAQSAAFIGSEGTIAGLEPGTSYDFIVAGMRWNPTDFSVVWGGWSNWASATPPAVTEMAGFGGPAQADAQATEPQTVGPATNLAASVDWQGPGYVHLTWTPAANAQVHYILYLTSADNAAGSFDNAQSAAFIGSEGTIAGLEPGTSYDFVVAGMRWNPTDFSAVWGGWSNWASVTPPAVTDRNVLIALYNATDGANWHTNENWLSDAPIGEWYGVTTDNNGRVTGLDLSNGHPLSFTPIAALLADLGNRLDGEIPSGWLGNLANLTHLDLGGNALTGAIPVELGNLANLTHLDLRWNALTGAIPAELGNLANLTHLDLRGNALTGAIPAELGNLANLTHLDLSWNDLTGAIPAELGNLANLTHLDLSWNDLTGAIPAELGNLANLTHLDLSWNDLSGGIPAELGNLANLTHLDLSWNDLSGGIPAELGNLANLTRLHLSGNDLTGAIPVELGNLANLRYLYLSGNDLTGCVPDGLRYVVVTELSLPFCAP